MARSHFTWAIVITGTGDDDLRVTCNAVTSTVTIAASTYYWRGDGDPTDAALALQTALNTHPQAAGGFTVSIAVTGYLTVTHGTRNFSILWADGATQLTDATWGSDGTNTASGLSWTSEYVVGKAWWPNRQPRRDFETPRRLFRRFQATKPSSEIIADYATWYDREIIFELVSGCRARDTWSSDATWAIAEGITTGDPIISFDSTLWEQLISKTPIYYHPGGVGVAVQNGPYYMQGQHYEIEEWMESTVQAGGPTRITVFLSRDP